MTLQTITYELSYRTLSIFDDCPRCFYQKIKSKIDRPSEPFPSLPSGMDLLLKSYFDTWQSRGVLPKELLSIEGISYFHDKELLRRWRGAGVRWTDGVGNVLVGDLDHVFVKKDKLLVADFKTRGFAVKRDTARYYIKQMQVYNFLLRKEGYKTNDDALLLFYHPVGVSDGAIVQFQVTPVYVHADPNGVEQWFAQAVACLNGKLPKPSDSCRYHCWAKRKVT